MPRGRSHVVSPLKRPVPSRARSRAPLPPSPLRWMGRRSRPRRVCRCPAHSQLLAGSSPKRQHPSVWSLHHEPLTSTEDGVGDCRSVQCGGATEHCGGACGALAGGAVVTIGEFRQGSGDDLGFGSRTCCDRRVFGGGARVAGRHCRRTSSTCGRPRGVGCGRRRARPRARWDVRVGGGRRPAQLSQGRLVRDRGARSDRPSGGPG